MPIYEYRCKICGATSEFLMVTKLDEAVSCHSCGSSEMEKLLSVVSVHSQSTVQSPDHTCCGKEERCEAPPCSTEGSCRRG